MVSICFHSVLLWIQHVFDIVRVPGKAGACSCARLSRNYLLLILGYLAFQVQRLNILNSHAGPDLSVWFSFFRVPVLLCHVLGPGVPSTRRHGCIFFVRRAARCTFWTPPLTCCYLPLPLNQNTI